MVDIHTVKDVDEADWQRFKRQAAREGLKLGTHLSMLVDEHESLAQKFWSVVLSHKPSLTESEAKSMEATLHKLRGERGFRK